MDRKDNGNYWHEILYEEPDDGKYKELWEIPEVQFNKWFNSNKLDIRVNSIEEILPTEEQAQKLKKMGFNSAQNLCHYNAQMASVLIPKLDFYTGLVYMSNGDYFTHSYNVYQNKIIDFSAKYFLNLEDDYLNYLPHIYSGVKIGKEFIQRYKTDIEENGEHTIPYLYESFKESLR